MLYALETIVNVELRSHHYETEYRDECHGCLQQEGIPLTNKIPSGMKGIPKVESHQRHQKVVHVPHRLRVDFLPLPVQLTRLQSHPRKTSTHLQGESPGNFPESHSHIEQREPYDHFAGIVLVDIQRQYCREDKFIEQGFQ